MKSKPQGIEALTIRRATIAEADKVRYRVYSSPSDFIAVIAESALMAVRVSGVSKPYKIVRDLPTEGIAIEAKKMAAMEAQAPRVNLSTEKSDKKTILMTDLLQISPEEKLAHFKPMNIADLQHKGIPRARILPPELLSQIIEDHTKASLPPIPKEESPVTAAVAPPPVAAPVVDPMAQLSPEERVLKAAESVLPPSEPLPEAATTDDGTLSPEEVEKLLNG